MNNLYILFCYSSILLLLDNIYKYYQLLFIKSIETNINLNYFIIFNSILLLYSGINIFKNYVNKIYLEIPLQKYILTNIFYKITTMPIIWIENNSDNYIKELITTSTSCIYNKHNQILEGYSSIINVLSSIYLLYNIYPSFIYTILLYLFTYYLFYNKIILINQQKNKLNNTNIFKLNIKNNNIFSTFYNSIIGHYNYSYIQYINNNNHKIHTHNLEITFREIIYHGSLCIAQKLLLIILLYYYISNNCTTKCSLYFLPIYQTTTTIIYQFEYMLHNYNAYNNNEQKLSIYYDFLDIYNKYNKKYKLNSVSKLPSILKKYEYIFNTSKQFIDYINNNRTNIYIDIQLSLQKNEKILLQGTSGVGKTTLCKFIAGHFIDSHNLNNILYISQDTLLHIDSRSLLNIITNNDINNNKLSNEDYNIISTIYNNIIPFNDIITSFDKVDWINTICTNNNSFSGGQKRRIFLFMWLYHLIKNIKKYKILIIDELEKGLDKELFDTLVQNILSYDLFKNIAIIFVSHYNIFELKTYYVYKENDTIYLK